MEQPIQSHAQDSGYKLVAASPSRLSPAQAAAVAEDALHHFTRLVAAQTGLRVRPQDRETWRQFIASRMQLLKCSAPEEYYQLLATHTPEPYDEQYLLRRIDYVLTNRKPRALSTGRAGLEIHFAGKSHMVDSDRQQILDLLLSTFENAVQQNRELIKTQLELKTLNDQLEQRNKFIRTTFGRYLTDEVVDSLLDSPEGTTLGGERRQGTMLMSDLRGFTSLAGRLAPEQVVTMVNRYLATMVEAIVQYQGTIDEFIGDAAILVIFGAPIWRQDDAQRAVACAVAMQLAMTTVNAENRRAGLPSVEMGIGVHTGEVVVGNIGSSKRAKYGVVGSHVNLTSRIQSYTIGGQILISEATRQAAGPLVSVAQQMDVEAKGIAHPVTLYELQGIGGAYNLFLPERAETLVPLRQVIPLQYMVLEGAYVGRTVYTGSLVTLSTQGGEVYTTHPVAPWSDVKIQLMGGNGEQLAGELYGKVLRHLPENRVGFYVSFTSVSSEVATFFQRLLAVSAPGPTA